MFFMNCFKAHQTVVVGPWRGAGGKEERRGESVQVESEGRRTEEERG